MEKKEKSNFEVSVSEERSLHVFAEKSRNCKKCGSTPKEHEVRNFDPMFRDGEVYCKKCGNFVRTYDPS